MRRLLIFPFYIKYIQNMNRISLKESLPKNTSQVQKSYYALCRFPETHLLLGFCISKLANIHFNLYPIWMLHTIFMRSCSDVLFEYFNKVGNVSKTAGFGNFKNTFIGGFKHIDCFMYSVTI